MTSNRHAMQSLFYRIPFLSLCWASSPLRAFRARPLRSLSVLVLAVVVLVASFAALGGAGSAQLQKAVIYRGAWSHPEGYIVNLDDRWALLENTFRKDPETGLEYPPDFSSAQNPYQREKAALVALVRNSELDEMRMSMREIEAAFNRKFGYPWVLLNDVPFTDGVVPPEHWRYPEWINQNKAAVEIRKMGEADIKYGGSLSYRHMCRYYSGFFFQHPLLQQFNYYWRFDPGVEYYCDIDYDPFVFMARNKKMYGFTIATHELPETVTTLWDSVKEFAELYPEHIASNNSLRFVSDERSLPGSGYNLCHFWSNFEIAGLRFYRSQAYQALFNFLDRKGGFFYERWGDAPVHSIAAALFLPSNQLHQFDDIGYRHDGWMHCPRNRAKYFETGKCRCDPKESFDRDSYSCMWQWWRVGQEPA